MPSPLFASDAVPPDLERALVGLRDGSISEGELRAAMEQSATATHELINSFYAAEIRSLKEQVATISGPSNGALAWPAFTIGAIVEAFAPGMVENGLI